MLRPTKRCCSRCAPRSQLKVQTRRGLGHLDHHRLRGSGLEQPSRMMLESAHPAARAIQDVTGDLGSQRCLTLGRSTLLGLAYRRSDGVPALSRHLLSRSAFEYGASPTSHEDKTAPSGGGARGNSAGAPAHRDRGLAKRRTPHCRSREVVREVQEPAPGTPAETGLSSAGRDGGEAGLPRRRACPLADGQRQLCVAAHSSELVSFEVMGSCGGHSLSACARHQFFRPFRGAGCRLVIFP